MKYQIQLFAMLTLLACLILDQHEISKQDREIATLLQSMDGAHKSMTKAREALQAQGNALDECMRVLDPKWKPIAATTPSIGKFTVGFGPISRPPLTTTGKITFSQERWPR